MTHRRIAILFCLLCIPLSACSGDGSDDSIDSDDGPIDTEALPETPFSCETAFEEPADCPATAGTTYYVSSSTGSDASDGRSEETPLATIAAVNDLALQPGDRVLFRCGDIWDTEQLLVRHSGEDCAHIIYSSYPFPCSVGEEPTLSGRRPITGWSDDGGGVWVADLSTGDNATRFLRGMNQLFLDGARLPMGVWPDPDELSSGFSPIDSHGGADIADSALPDGDWTGAMARIRTVRWLLLNYPVASSTSGALTLEQPVECYADTCAGFGLQLTDHLATLSREGEWYFDRNTLRVYLYSAAEPADITASAIPDMAAEDEAAWSHDSAILIGNHLQAHVHHVVIENLLVEGWFGSGIGYPVNLELDENADLVIRCNRIENVNARGMNFATWVWNAGDLSDWYGGRNLVVEGNVIAAPNHFGIHSYARNSLFEGNVITDVGRLENLTRSGLGCEFSSANCTENGDGIHLPVSRAELNSYGVTLRRNELRRIAYCGFDVFGHDVVMEENLIEEACITKADCGAIRTFGREGDNPAHDIEIVDNLLVRPVGEVGGGGPGFDTPMAFGLYIDHGSTGVTAAGNAIVGTPSAGILYQDSTGTIEGNLLFDAPDAEWAINAPAVTPGDNLIATTGNPAGAEIFYNDTAVPVVIPLAAGYADLDGNPVSELSLDPFDAAVLVATMR